MTITKHTKLYIVSEFVDEKTNSTGYFWFKIIKGLSGQLENINVISLGQSCQKAIAQNNHVVYVPIKDVISSGNKGFFWKLRKSISLSFKFSFTIFRVVKRKDIIFSGTNPSMLVLFIAILRPLIGFRWVLLVNDIFPENLPPAKLISSKSYIYKTMKVLFDYAYKRADKIIVIGRDMKKIVEKKTNNISRVEYIPNWVDLNDVSIFSKNSYQPLAQANLENKVVFQFFGNMGVVQGLDILLASISKTKNKKAKFVFIGSGSGVDLVTEFLKTNPCQDIELFPPIDFKDNNVGLNACDVAMVSLAPGMSGLAVPSKAYFSLAADKPIFVIGDKGAELESLIEDNEGIGWYCSSYNSAEVAKMFDEICELDLSTYHSKPRSVIKNQHSYHSAAAQYLSIINELD
jgi:hypothetical protein